MNKPVILCVDDERVILTSLMDQLIHFLDGQYVVEVSESGEEALEVLEECLAKGIEVPLIISDQIMPGMKGDELLITIHNRYPQALKIFLTGQADANAVGNALNNANLYRYLGKPWDEADLRLTIIEALYTYHQEKLLVEKQAQIENALAQERLAKEAFRQANEVLEQRVQARTAELAQANAQLQADMRQQKLLEQELRAAKEAADAANLAKSAFLANMSHELRTPLNVILGFAQLMAQSLGLTPEFEENFRLIIRSGEHLLILINQILDVSKIEFGKMIVHPTTFDLYQLLDDVFDLFRLTAEQRGLQLLFDCAPDVPCEVFTDEVKLRQVLINLLDNALKFTKEGGVAVRVRKIENCQLKIATWTGEKDQLQASSFQLQFEVEDTGRGIAPDEMPTLFEAFVQTKSGQQLQEGTGLGLYLSRKFVRLMGGDMLVRSNVGQGAVFTFELPVTLAASAPPPPAPIPRAVMGLTPDQPPYRILIADDKREHRGFLVKLLTPIGFELWEVENGQNAFAVWEHWRPHLIWMDLDLTGSDGYQTTSAIRAREAENPQGAPFGGHTMIIATTARRFSDERAAALAAGCDDFLYQPLHKADILEMMRKYLGVRYVYTKQTGRLETNPSDRMRLIATMLVELPKNLQACLQYAVEAINLEQTNHLIAQIRSHNAPLADALAGLVKHYRFDTLQELFEKIP